MKTQVYRLFSRIPVKALANLLLLEVRTWANGSIFYADTEEVLRLVRFGSARVRILHAKFDIVQAWFEIELGADVESPSLAELPRVQAEERGREGQGGAPSVFRDLRGPREHRSNLISISQVELQAPSTGIGFGLRALPIQWKRVATRESVTVGLVPCLDSSSNDPKWNLLEVPRKGLARGVSKIRL